jgi:small subunit ribosomal protein S15
MSIAKKDKAATIKRSATSAKDTGSPEVQVALLTQRILMMTEHMKIHKKDMGSRSGLLRMVGKRRDLLNYLKKIDSKRYEAVLDKEKLRR